MAKPNWNNRTIWTGDNLGIMRGMASESVDLIYLDPPFNSKHNYAAPIGSRAAGAAFKDTWTLKDVDMEWWADINEANRALYEVLDMARHVGGKSTTSYLIYMAMRILEMHRILKETGSLYLHCDPTMSHYLKMVMDSIFRVSGFRNELVWCYTGNSTTKDKFLAKHDIILFYSKGKSSIFNQQFLPYSEATIRRYNHVDEDGRRYKMSTLRNGLEKVYMKEGKPIEDWWKDIPVIRNTERLGYPTQKPLALLERMIKASSNEGDWILDPFCGCATACLAAERLNRKWVGIDISSKAVELMNARMISEAGIEKWTKGAGLVIQRTDMPMRKGNRSKDIKKQLFGTQEGRCNLCRHGMDFRHMEVDHKIPKAKGGPDDDTNLQLLCGHCNRVKGSGTMAEAKVRLKEMRIIV